MNRRNFLKSSGGLIFGVSVIGLGGCEFNSVDPITTGKSIPFLTPVDDFYYKNGAELSVANWTLPIINQDSWRLRIDGLVSSPLEISYADIEAESANAINLLKTMRCVVDSNSVQGLIGTAVWRGVPLRTFMEQAGLDTGATRRIRFYGEDTFTNNITINELLSPAEGLIEPLLVTHMNDLPLTAEHGAPVRLIIHNSFGYKNVKWLNRVEATASDEVFGTYQDEGFVDDGIMRVSSRATNPLENAEVPAGLVTVEGFAVSGAAGITSVEVSVDGGGFTAATIQSEAEVLASDPLIAEAIQFTQGEGFSYPFKAVWVKWTYEFEATPGVYTIDIKATDAAGAEQPATDSTIDDSLNAVSTVTFTVV